MLFKIQRHYKIYFLLSTLIIVILSSTSLPSFTQPQPRLINFQGKLTNQQGQVLDGTYTVIFSLYATATGRIALWTERHENLSIANGLVNALLGSIQSLDDPQRVNFEAPRYLGITIDVDNNENSPYPEMLPRQRVVPAIHAYGANYVKEAEKAKVAETAEAVGGITADQIWHIGNMGSDSGLNADLLYGLDSSQLIPPPPGKLHYQEFKTSSTWIRSEGFDVIKVLLVGGVGGGGGRNGGAGSDGENSTLSSGATLVALGGAGGSSVGGNSGGSYTNGAIGYGHHGEVGVGSFGGVTGGGGGAPAFLDSGAGGECAGFGRGGNKRSSSNSANHCGGGGSYGPGATGGIGLQNGSSAGANTGGGGGGGGNDGDSGQAGGGGQIIFRYVPVTGDITDTIGAGGTGGSDSGYVVGGSGGSDYCLIMWYE